MANEEESDSKGFRVVDRRRFTSEGEARADAPERPEPPRSVAPPPVQPAAPREQARPEPRQDPRSPRGPAKGPDAPDGRRGGVDFIQFVASLATNALAAMGAIPEARAQGMPVNFDMAREYIDIIAMLQEKTRGNLDREEDAALQRLIGELRLHFVELSQRGAPPRK